MTEGYHKHEYSVENQAAAFAFLDRFNGITSPATLAPTTVLDNEAVRCTTDGAGAARSSGRPIGDGRDSRLLQGARGHAARRRSRRRTTGAGYPGVAQWPERQIQWEPAGTSTFDGVAIDKYLLRHSGGLVMPLLHLHREGVAGTRIILWISDHGKAGAADWGAMQKLLADGYDVVTFDGRGLGETRMRYRAVSEDDPTLVAGDFDTAYVSPLSSVLADYVYNTLLTGRPYLLQMIEDVEIRGTLRADAPEGD